MLILVTISFSVFSMPSQVIIIRHADKLLTKNKAPTLNAKGYIRAIKFASYYIKNFPKPDYLFAKNPLDERGAPGSFRELQTLAPLANIIAEQNMQQFVTIYHPYIGSDYQLFADLLLNDKTYNKKIILVCWNHMFIPKLARALGVDEEMPEWSNNDFDTVYVLNFNQEGRMLDFQILRDQYPVAEELNWGDLEAMVS